MKNIILKLLKDEPTRKFNSYEFVKVNTRYGWLGISADRRARELFEEGRVNHEIDKETGYALFWYKHPQPIPTFQKLNQLSLI